MARSGRPGWWGWALAPILLTLALVVALIPTSASAAIETGTVSGVITDLTNAPVGNVQVELYDSADGGSSGTFERYGTTASADGSYTITGVEVGTYYVYIDTDPSGTPITDSSTGLAYLSEWYGATPGAVNSLQESSATPVTVTNGGMSIVSTHITTGAEITGTVTDAAGDTLTDCEVDLYDAGGEKVSDDIFATPKPCTYDFASLLPGTYYLHVEGEDSTGDYTYSGHPVDAADAWDGPSGLAESMATSTGFTLSAGASAPVTANLTLPAATTVSGLVETDGNPEGDASAVLYDAAGNPTGNPYGYSAISSRAVNTDADGTYTIAHVLAGTYLVGFYPGAPNDAANDVGNLAFQFWSGASSLSTATPISPTVASPSQNVDANLVTGGEISGTVTDAGTGKPLPNVQVDLLDAQGHRLEYATTETDGSYLIDAIPTGSYYLEFSVSGSEAPDYQDQYYSGKQVLAGSNPVSVTAGSTTTGINAAMGPISTGAQTLTVAATTTAPVPTVTASVPTITGTAKVASILTANVPGWSVGASFSYQWSAGGQAIPGATLPTLTLTPAQYRQAITVTVTGRLSGYDWATQTSAATAAVAAGTLKHAVPKISGVAKVGHTLTAAHGSWTTGTKFTYRWYAGSQQIAGATKASLTLTSAEAGKRITVKVTGKLPGYVSAATTSRATAKVA